MTHGDVAIYMHAHLHVSVLPKFFFVVVAARKFGDSFRELCCGVKPSLAVLVRIGMNLLYFKVLNNQRRSWLGSQTECLDGDRSTAFTDSMPDGCTESMP